MKRDKRVVGAALIASSTFALSIALTGCGADDSVPPTTSSTASPSASQNIAANDTAQQNAPLSPAALVPNASAPFAADLGAASDPVALTMQANLAADNQQVAPVMRYAPGDSQSSN